MKIVSKYKDFYDSFGFITGKPDESITYVRNTKYIDVHSKDYKKPIEYLKSITYTETSGFNTDPFVAYLNTIIVGFYPYIYICPFYVIVQRKSKTVAINSVIQEIKPITISEDDVISNREHIYTKIQTKFNEFKKMYNVTGTLHIHKLQERKWTYYPYNRYDIKTQPWKIENHDIFRTLKSPVFVYIDPQQNISEYMEGNTGLILDPVIVKLPFDILGASREKIINEQNVYIDIENFLWENKQEPIVEPNNNTKIINAGFDLKTSFRKVK